MRSPLAPVLANTFMGFYKCKWLNEYNFKKPKFYLRYVDDIPAGKGTRFIKFFNFFIISIQALNLQ